MGLLGTEVDTEIEEMGGDARPATGGTLEVQQARDAMVKAAEEAIRAEANGETPPDGEEEVDEEAERAAKKAAAEKRNKAPLVAKLEQDGKAAPIKVEKDDPDENMSVVARELAKREADRKAKTEYDTKIAEADATLAKVNAVWSEVQKAQEELARGWAELEEARKNPVAAFKKFGWNPDDVIEASVNSKDPSYQRFMQAQQAATEAQNYARQLEQRLARLEQTAKGYEEERQQAQQAQQQNEVQSLLKSIPEDSPVWSDYEDEEDIVYKANKVRRQYHTRTGKVASAEELAQYLHYEALKKRGGAPDSSTGPKPKTAGKTKANGSRALGNADASERRGGDSKTINDMSRDEERDFLINVATTAMMQGD